jgi:hypothetical protein
MQSFAVLAAFVVIVLARPHSSVWVHIHRLHFLVDSQNVGFFFRKSGITNTYNAPWITQTVVE